MVAACDHDIALTQVLIGDGHPHTQSLASGHGVGIHIEFEGHVDAAPVAHAVGIGGGAHRLQVILAAYGKTLVARLLLFGLKLRREQPQVAHALAKPPFLAVDGHHLKLTVGLPTGQLLGSDIGHTLTNERQAFLGSHREVLANALHDGLQRIDTNSVGLTNFARQLVHDFLGTGKVAKRDALIYLRLPRGHLAQQGEGHKNEPQYE